MKYLFINTIILPFNQNTDFQDGRPWIMSLICIMGCKIWNGTYMEWRTLDYC